MLFLNENFQAMGTDISLELHLPEGQDLEAAEKTLKEARAMFVKNEAIFSRFDTRSELSRLNRSQGKPTTVSAEMYEILELCLDYYQKTNGFFDPRIADTLVKIGYDKDFRSNDLCGKDSVNPRIQPKEGNLADDMVLDHKSRTVHLKAKIDTTGLVKGHTVDQVSAFLEARGYTDYIVDAGGDLFGCYASAGPDQPLTVCVEGVTHDKLLLKLKCEGIATSGCTRKQWVIGDKTFHHLINPQRPEYFSVDLSSVSVIATTTLEADVYAKALFLMGDKLGHKFAEEKAIKGLFLASKGDILLTEAMKENIWTASLHS